MLRRSIAAFLVVLALSPVTGAGPVRADTNEARPGSSRGAASLVAAGSEHTCAVAAGAVLCWGRNTSGQLGIGSTANASTDSGANVLNGMSDGFVPLGTGRTASAVAAGILYTCALLDNGQVKCWGAGVSGRLGQGNGQDLGDQPGELGDNLPPVALGTGRTATAITAGGAHACALLDTGQVKCWGDNSAGQLGQGHRDDLGDQPGELGDNLPPVPLGTGRTATAITAGSSFTCALLDTGQVKCWGLNSVGQLGQGNGTSLGDQPGELGDNLPPVPLGTGRTATAIATGSGHACALLDTGRVKCWGSGTFGQLGQGNGTSLGDQPGELGDNLPPVPLGTGRTATAITTGDFHVCALSDNAQVKCWGYNDTGQLGQNSTLTRGDELGEMGDALTPVTVRRFAATLAGPQPFFEPLVVNTAPTAPAPPTAVSSIGGGSTAIVSWTAPTDDGGAAVTGYRIELSTDGGTIWSVAVANTASTATSATVGGLTPGAPVRFRVSAINNRGVSPASLPSTPVPVGFVSLPPARLLDTRPDGDTIDGQFLTRSKVGSGGEIALQVTGRGGVPTGADAVALNVTVTDPEGPGFVTAYPCGTTRPNASNLNYTTGAIVPNNVIVRLSPTGTVCLYSQRPANVIADVNGAFTGPGYASVDPARLLDTRPDGDTVDGLYRTRTKVGTGGELVLQVTGRGGVPTGADAVVLNVTVTDPEGPGFVTAYPCGTTRPNASNLNYTAGAIVANNVIVRLSPTGTVCLYSQRPADLIADVNGAFL